MQRVAPQKGRHPGTNAVAASAAAGAAQRDISVRLRAAELEGQRHRVDTPF